VGGTGVGKRGDYRLHGGWPDAAVNKPGRLRRSRYNVPHLGLQRYYDVDGGVVTAAAASTVTWPPAPQHRGHLRWMHHSHHAGIGIGQARLITAYTNTRIATVSPAWTTQPTTASVYVVLPVGRTYVNQLADGVITNATFNADVGTTAYATNIIALAGT